MLSINTLYILLKEKESVLYKLYYKGQGSVLISKPSLHSYIPTRLQSGPICVWGANSASNCVYLLNSDRAEEKNGMCEAKIGLSSWLKHILSYKLIYKCLSSQMKYNNGGSNAAVTNRGYDWVENEHL